MIVIIRFWERQQHQQQQFWVLISIDGVCDTFFVEIQPNVFPYSPSICAAIALQQQQKAPLFVRFSSFMQLIRFHIISRTISFSFFLPFFLRFCTFGICFYQLEFLPCLALHAIWTPHKNHTFILLFDLCKINSHRHNAHLGCCFCVNFIENLYRFIKSYFLQFNKQQQLENR